MVATMASRTERLGSLNSLRSRLPHLSQKALSTILQIAQVEELPRAYRRQDIRAARDQVTSKHMPYGPIHQTCRVPLASGGDLEVEIQNPQAMLFELAGSSETFSSLVERTFDRCTPTATAPWSIILYNDEVTPGAEMRAHNPRKLEVFYWSIYQFGMHVLSDEESWLEVVVLQSSVRQRLKGGLSALAAAVLSVFFGGGGHDVRLAGVQLELRSGRRIHVWLDLGHVLADEAALHAMFLCKGAAGLKPCMLCANVFNDKLVDDKADLETRGGVTHTCGDVRQLQFHTEESFQAAQARLKAAKSVMRIGEYAELEKHLGWKISELLGDARLAAVLKPTRQVLFDTMHVLFSKGVFQFHVGSMLVALKRLRVTTSMFHAYMQPWVWPKLLGTATGKDVFSSKSIRSCLETGVLTCQASECVSLYPIMANYIKEGLLHNPSPAIQSHARCFMLLVTIIEMIMNSCRYAIDGSALSHGVKAYMGLFRELYGDDLMPPKFHQLVHFVRFISALGWFPNCWVLERKHRVAKRFAGINLNSRTKRVGYSASVLREVTLRHVSKLQGASVHFPEEVCLIAPTAAPARLARLLAGEFGENCSFCCSRTARINKWEKISRGDMVLYAWEGIAAVGRVDLLASVACEDGQGVFAYVSACDVVGTRARDQRVRFTGASRMVVLSEIQQALIWSANGLDVTVLRPWSQR